MSTELKRLTALWTCSWSESLGSSSASSSGLGSAVAACRTAWAAAGHPRKASSRHIWYRGPGAAPERYPVLKSPIVSATNKSRKRKYWQRSQSWASFLLTIFDSPQRCSCKLLRKPPKLIQKWEDINDTSADNKGEGSVTASIHYFWRFDLISGPETHTLSPWTQKTIVTARLWLGLGSRGNCFSVNFWGEQIRGLVFCCILWPCTHLLNDPPFFNTLHVVEHSQQRVQAVALHWHNWFPIKYTCHFNSIPHRPWWKHTRALLLYATETPCSSF